MTRGTVEELDAGAGDYLEALAKFIEEHESGAFPIRSRAPRETLRFLMEQHGMRAIDLAAIVGGSGAASMLLKGDREPSKAQIQKAGRALPRESRAVSVAHVLPFTDNVARRLSIGIGLVLS